MSLWRRIRLFLFDLNAWIRMNKRGLKTDPHGLATKPVEIRKRARGIEILKAHGPFVSCLDVGCAEGYLTRDLASLTQRILALDISHTALRRARSITREINLSHIRFVQGGLRRWNALERFDLVLASEVLYSIGRKHSEEAYQKLLDKIASWVKPAGFFYLANSCTNEADKADRINIRENFEQRGFRILHEEYFENYSLLTLLQKDES